MLAQRAHRAGVDVARQAHLQRNASVEHVLRERAELYDFAIEDGHVVGEPRGVAEAVRAAELQRLPDARHAEGFARVERGIEIRALNRGERLGVFLRRMPRFLAREIEPDDAIAAKIDGEFRRLQRVRAVAHGADDDAPLHAILFLPASQPVQHRAHDGLIRQSALAVKARGKAHLGIDHAVMEHVLDELEGHALQRGPRLHHANGVLEAFEVERERAAIRAAKKPRGQFLGVAGRETGVIFRLREIDDGLRAQAAVEVFMEQDFGQGLEIHRHELSSSGARGAAS